MLMLAAPGQTDDVDEQDETAATHVLRLEFDPGEAFEMRRRRCGRGEWASAASAEEEVEGDKGGWRWEWC